MTRKFGERKESSDVFVPKSNSLDPAECGLPLVISFAEFRQRLSAKHSKAFTNQTIDEMLEVISRNKEGTSAKAVLEVWRFYPSDLGLNRCISHRLVYTGLIEAGYLIPKNIPYWSKRAKLTTLLLASLGPPENLVDSTPAQRVTMEKAA